MYKTLFLSFLLYFIHIDSNMFYNTDFRSFVLDLGVKKYRSHINSFSSFLWKCSLYTWNSKFIRIVSVSVACHGPDFDFGKGFHRMANTLRIDSNDVSEKKKSKTRNAIYTGLID